MQPFDYDLQCPAPKDNGITHAAAEPSNLDAAAPHTHKQGTLHRRLQPLSTEKHKVSCSGFLPKPLQCVLERHVANLHVSTHMATQDDNNHAAIPIRSASTDSRNEWNYAHMNNHTLQNTKGEPILNERIAAATAAHTRYPSSPLAAISREKT